MFKRTTFGMCLWPSLPRADTAVRVASPAGVGGDTGQSNTNAIHRLLAVKTAHQKVMHPPSVLPSVSEQDPSPTTDSTAFVAITT